MLFHQPDCCHRDRKRIGMSMSRGFGSGNRKYRFPNRAVRALGGSAAIAVAVLCVTAAARADYLKPLPVKPERSPCILLEGEPRGEKTALDQENVKVCYGELIEHDVARAFTSGNTLVLRKDGYVHSSAKLRYPLPDGVQPGRYDVWTSFTLGGVATQGFTVRGGPDPEHLQKRSAFNQSNGVSWKMQWRKASSQFSIYPGDKYIEIVVAGMATQQKDLDAFALVLAEALPSNVTLESAESAGWRAAADSFVAGEPEYRVYIFEGDDGRDADPFFRYFAGKEAVQRKDKIAVTTFRGENVAAFAKRMRVESLPAMLVMNNRYTLRGALTGKTDDERVKAFMDSAMKAGRAPGPFLKRAASDPESPEPLRQGSPRAWLVIDGWGGPAGLSLWGIDTEPRVRPNPDEPRLAVYFDRRQPTKWRPVQANDKGMAVINSRTTDYAWATGVGYAHLYLHADRDVTARLHLAHTGIYATGWLDGQRLELERDSTPPESLLQEQPTDAIVAGTNDQGGRVKVRLATRAPAQAVTLTLEQGWHRLLVKLVMQHKKGETFALAAKLTDSEGAPLAGVQTRLSDPEAALDINAEAVRLSPLVYADAPLNLAYPGKPLKLRVDLRRLPRREDRIVTPLVPFDAKLSVLVTNYDGREVARRETSTQFPAVVTIDLGTASETGYYAVHTTLHHPDGRLIAAYPADGFSVIRGTAAQEERKAKKKVAVCYYFMAGNQKYRDLYFPWMQRMGIYRNIGSNPGFPIELGEAAKQAGIFLTADFWDIHNAYTQQQRLDLANRAAQFTPWFKSFNEVDIHPTVRRTPSEWVQRVKGEYEAAKAARPSAVYVGGSLVRTGTDDWFTECLRLGLEKHHDAWDVHAYPKYPPKLEGTLSNSSNETELGVFTCFQRAGKTNTLPFWIGETGARSCHGFDGRRWQADMVAKMVACVASREDFHYIGFLVPWQYSRARGSHSDIETGHMPAEAAYYTASALIDGFPYQRLDLGQNIQAAQFGETMMLWTTGQPTELRIPIATQEPMVRVDVVGRVHALPTDNGAVRLQATGSPVYVLKRDLYERLTSF